ncbi:hypothetical protein MC885_002039 [Smutsia gigantea]|nr:hypothetical protein MC885_002039 [Smutsia gigantea]
MALVVRDPGGAFQLKNTSLQQASWEAPSSREAVYQKSITRAGLIARLGPGGRAAAKGTPLGHWMSVTCKTKAASGTRATCTGRTSPPLPQASAASTGWPHRAARGLPSRLASATTATAGTQTRIRAGPGATSAARQALRRSGLARTCSAQVPAGDPGDLGIPGLPRLGLPGSGRYTRRAQTTSQVSPTSTETEEVSEVPGGDEVQVYAPASNLPARSKAAAVQPVVGISQRVRVNSKEKKDLGTLGYVLGITMMVIIIVIGAGIVLGYTYKRGKDLKEHHGQRVYEREMQRITLPLSAFTNPTCEIVDEKTVVVHTSQTPVHLQEGSAPLMGQAGTPGA